MIIMPVQNVPRLNTTPLASIRIKDSRVIAEVDDEREARFNLIFEPYQAVKITTSDCFALPDTAEFLPNTVMEVEESDWISQLIRSVKKVDESATFMEKARHFIVPLQDDVLEVVAWGVKVSKAIEGG